MSASLGADLFQGILFSQPLDDLGLFDPIGCLSDNADPEHMADRLGDQQAGKPVDHGRAFFQFGCQGQAQAGNRALFFMGELVKYRGLGRKGALNLVFRHTGRLSGPGDDLVVRDQSVPGAVHHVPDHRVRTAENAAEDGNDRHR